MDRSFAKTRVRQGSGRGHVGISLGVILGSCRGQFRGKFKGHLRVMPHHAAVM